MNKHEVTVLINFYKEGNHFDFNTYLSVLDKISLINRNEMKDFIMYDGIDLKMSHKNLSILEFVYEVDRMDGINRVLELLKEEIPNVKIKIVINPIQ